MRHWDDLTLKGVVSVTSSSEPNDANRGWVRQRVIEVENPGMDGFGYSFDGLGLRTREAGCPEAFHAGVDDFLRAHVSVEIVSDSSCDGVRGLHRHLLRDHRSHQ